MKSCTLLSLGLGLVVVGVLLVAASSRETSSPATDVNAVLAPETNAMGGLAPETNANPAQALSGAEAEAEEPDEESDLADAAVTPISTEKPLPPNLKLTGPVVEVVKLAESGVEESVMMAFVTNSVSPFNLGVEEILYLNDVGVPGSVVAAMIQRDQALKELSGGGAPAEPAPTTATNQVAAPPGDPGLYAPQPAETAAPAEMAPEPAQVVETETGYPVFYDSLAPYGTWINVAGWGPCWQPTVVIVNRSWRPYCDGGRWIYSDCGWYWLSSYSWGWAPFHYGRWFRHHRIGWCWAPDRIWGPSWVCWRYSGSHCGWAPLPPRCSFRPGVGLSYRGRPVHGEHGFGLRASSFTFVDVNHFRDRHLGRRALPPRQADRIFSQTRPSTPIVENNGRVINDGIPASRVAAATRTQVQRVTIRPIDNAARRGSRGEQFAGDGRTLTVFRPNFSPSAGTTSGSGGRSRPELGSRGGSPTLTPIAQRPVPDRLPQVSGPSVPVQPYAPAAAASRPQHPTALPTAPTVARTGPETTVPNPGQDTATRPADQAVLRGAERPNRSTMGIGIGAARENGPRQTPAFGGRTDFNQRRPSPVPPAPVAEAPQVRPTPAPQTTISRPAVNLRSPQVTSPSTTSSARSEPRRSGSRATEAPSRTQRSPQITVPSSPAPAFTPRTIPTPTTTPSRSTPAPTFSSPRSTPRPAVVQPRSIPAPTISPTPSTPRPAISSPPARSSSAPSVSSAPRAPAVQSRPTPSAPATSAPTGQGRPSSGGRGR